MKRKERKIDCWEVHKLHPLHHDSNGIKEGVLLRSEETLHIFLM